MHKNSTCLAWNGTFRNTGFDPDRNSQVIDLKGLFQLAHWMGNLAEGLIFKASRASRAAFPQSYPQFFGIPSKVL
jgi:hypothetical protein